MVLAQESPFGITGALAQHVAAMPAGIDEAAQLFVLAPHDDEGLIEDLIHLPVPDLGQVVDSAHDLPHPHPDRFPLTLLKFDRRVSVGGDAHRVEVVVVGQGADRVHPFAGPRSFDEIR